MPKLSTRSAQYGWSAICGTTTCGVPARAAVVVVTHRWAEGVRYAGPREQLHEDVVGRRTHLDVGAQALQRDGEPRDGLHISARSPCRQHNSHSATPFLQFTTRGRP